MPEVLLQVEGLQITFSNKANQSVFTAVDEISFHLGSGEVLGIVGESGSGKSLTALAIMGLLPESAQFQAKRIHLSGHERSLHQLDQKAYEQIRGNEIAMIFQEPMSSLNPVFRCGHQIRETLMNNLGMPKKAAMQEAKKWLQKVGVAEVDRVYQSFPHQLSGGQKQRAMIAIAMCSQPKLLIADEPTTALDVTIQRRIIDLLLQLKEETGTSIIFISHDLAVVHEMADRVLVMQKGAIVEQGNVKQIFKHAQHPYTRGLIACRPILGKDYYRLPTLDDYLDEKTITSSPASKTKRKDEKATIPLLRIEDLSLQYKEQQAFWKATTYKKAVDTVSLNILKGETLGLVGESGCGKSSLAKVIAQLIPSTEGNIYYKDQVIQSIPKKEYYQQVQMIFQNPDGALNPRIPIGEAVLEPLGLHHKDKSRSDLRDQVYQLLQQVGLPPDSYAKYPHQFSGGQKQRICIARALVVAPDLLICDEIVSALDVSVQAQILNLLKDIQEERNLSMLFISHDLSVVEFMSDRIAVMYAGKMLEIGESEQIYKNPSSAYTRSLIQAIPGQIAE